jgi:YHS domain-containing protein
MIHFITVMALALLPNIAFDEDEAKLKKVTPASETYPISSCAVAGKTLGSMGAPFVHIHEGRQVKFCCKACLPAFKKNPAKYLAKVDEKIVAQQKASYPTDKCLFSDEPLGDKSKDVVVNNRLVRVCCGGCARKLMKNPAPTLKKLDELIIANQGKKYPTTKCVISGEDLGSMGKPKDVIVANTLVRVCCKGCVKKVTDNPADAVKMLQKAKMKK